MALTFLPTVDTKLGTKIVTMLRDGKLEKWIQFGEKNKTAQRLGLIDMIKEYNSTGKKVEKITLRFSANRLLGEHSLSGSPEQTRPIFNAVSQLADKESVIRMLDIFEHLM